MTLSDVVDPAARRIRYFLGRLIGDEQGATAIEYSMIAALLSVAIIGGITTFGSQLNTGWVWAAGVIGTALSKAH